VALSIIGNTKLKAGIKVRELLHKAVDAVERLEVPNKALSFAPSVNSRLRN